MATDAEPHAVLSPRDDMRRILSALLEEQQRLHPARDSALLAANAQAVAYWRELLARGGKQ